MKSFFTKTLIILGGYKATVAIRVLAGILIMILSFLDPIRAISTVLVIFFLGWLMGLHRRDRFLNDQAEILFAQRGRGREGGDGLDQREKESQEAEKARRRDESG